MKAISTGNVYRIYDDTLKTYDQLPAQPYVVRFSNQTGFFLERYADIEKARSTVYIRKRFRKFWIPLGVATEAWA